MTKQSFFSKIFGYNDESETEIRKVRSDSQVEKLNKSDAGTLADVINFVAELQSYYYNDICKMQTGLTIQNELPSKEKFINKKIQQDKIALMQIDEILKEIEQCEREYHKIAGKAIYSFYEEIEQAKLLSIQEKVFQIIIKLGGINTKPELKSVILKKIETYKTKWKINKEIQIPSNCNAVIIDEKDEIEKYQFGEFSKEVYSSDNDKTLTLTQFNQIRELKVEFEDKVEVDSLWVYVSSVSRLQLNFMRRTSVIENDWEYMPDLKDKLCYDIVKTEKFEEYIKGILQIILSKKTYAVISIIIPTDDMVSCIGPVKYYEGKVEILKKYWFYLRERSGVYKNNLLSARIDRRNIPEKLPIISYLKFRKIHF